MIQNLVEYIVKSLVASPDAVRVVMHDTDDVCKFEIFLAEQDRGRVIGRQGQTIKAIRTLLQSIMYGKKAIVIDVVRAS